MPSKLYSNNEGLKIFFWIPNLIKTSILIASKICQNCSVKYVFDKLKQ